MRSSLAAGCVIAFGIPMTQQTFFRHKATPGNRDFAIRCCSTWPKYNIEIAQHYRSLRPILDQCGVEVQLDTTIEGLRQLFARQWHALVLFSHWSADSIELDSGLATIEDITACVPTDFCAVIDLCVCHPVKLVTPLKRERPNSLVRFTDTAATPAFWLHFYGVLFRIMHDDRVRYIDALERAVSYFIPQQGDTNGAGQR